MFPLAHRAAAPAQPVDHAQDTNAGADDAAHGAADLRASGAPPQAVHGHFDQPQAVLDRLDLHLDRPAVRRVAHVELPQRAGANGPQRPEISDPRSPQQADQQRRYPVARDLRQRERARLHPAQRARADGHVGAGSHCLQHVERLVRRAGAVAVGEEHDVHRRQGLEPSQAGAAVAGLRLAHHPRARAARAVSRAVRRAVVAHHEVVQDTLSRHCLQAEQFLHHHTDVAGLVARGYHGADAQVVVHAFRSAGQPPAAGCRRRRAKSAASAARIRPNSSARAHGGCANGCIW